MHSAFMNKTQTKKKNRQASRKQSNKMMIRWHKQNQIPIKSPMKCDKPHGCKPLQRCIDASKAQCANSMCSRTVSCGKHGSFTIQLKMHKTMRNQSRWNWKTLHCALQLQNNDNNMQWRAFITHKHAHQGVWSCKWQETNWVNMWMVGWKAVAVEEVYLSSLIKQVVH